MAVLLCLRDFAAAIVVMASATATRQLLRLAPVLDVDVVDLPLHAVAPVGGVTTVVAAPSAVLPSATAPPEVPESSDAARAEGTQSHGVGSVSNTSAVVPPIPRPASLG